MIKEQDKVILTEDLEKHCLPSGTLGTVKQVYDSGEAYNVKFLSPDGKQLARLTLEATQVELVDEEERQRKLDKFEELSEKLLDSLVEFQGQLVTLTDITIFQGDLKLSTTSESLNEVEGDSGTVEIELGGLVPLQDKVSLHWNLFCHPRLTNQLQSVRW